MNLYYKPIIIISFLLFSIMHTYGQFWLSNEDIYIEAEEYVDAEEYIEALPLYQLLEKKELLTDNIRYKIGMCYLNIPGKKDKAIAYLEKASLNVACNYTSSLEQEHAPVKSLLLLGVAYRVNYRFDKAIETFHVLIDTLQNCDPSQIPLAKWHVERCKNAKLSYHQPNKYDKRLLSPIINNSYSNYNPIVIDSGNTLLYMDALKFYDALMQSHYHDSVFSTPTNLTPVIGSDGDHFIVGASCDGNQLFFNFFNDFMLGDIYSTKRVNGKWGKLFPLDSIINTPYNETYASYCNQSNTLYFTSNKPGGNGGTDIYYSKLNADSTWGAPVNLGATINTIYNEAAPFFIASENKLYFTSQGHKNMGGYDVFYSVLKNGNWGTPVNLGYPVSTSDNDEFYFPYSSKTGYMAQYMSGVNNQYDIYEITLYETPKKKFYFIEYDFDDNPDLQKTDSVNVLLVNAQTGDTVSNETTSTKHPYLTVQPAGEYQIVFSNKNETLEEIEIEIAPELPIDNINISLAQADTNQGKDTSTKQLAQDSTNNDVNLQLSQQNQKIIVEKRQTQDTLQIHDILFAFDNAEIKSEYHVLIDSITAFVKTYDALVNLYGHTDSKGPHDYNLLLSEKRAKNVANKFIENGIDENKIKIFAKGENHPICINSNKDGSDNQKGRYFNRRVQIELVSSPKNIIIIYKRQIPKKLLVNP